MKTLQVIVLTILFLSFTVVTTVYLDLRIYSEVPAHTGSSQRIVTVAPGQGFNTLSEELHAEGLIRQPVKFRWLARIKRQDKNIKAGEYQLSPDMSPNTILDILVSGKVRLYRITVPEGYNLHQIAHLVAEAGFGAESEFLKAASDPGFAREKSISADTFEGYLFPDTYFFPRGASPRYIISTMVDRFWSVFTPDWKKQAQALNLSVHQVVTLASIIEKETGAALERPIISSVFHNRLDRRMRLESDPTVIYGIKEYKGNITKKHLMTSTPYNTYKIQGLPPGPIASAGAAALKAALFPAETNYLYFVSKKDKTHQFSTNIKDHNRAVRKYQLRK